MAKLTAIVPDFMVQGWHYLRENNRYMKLFTAVTMLLTFVVIGRVIYSNWDILLSVEWEWSPIWLLPTAVIMFIKLLLGGLGWHFLLLKGARLNEPRYNVKVWWAANMARRIPGGIWYIASRATMYDRFGIHKRTISALSVLELIIILTSGGITLLISSPLWVITREELLGSYDWLLFSLIPLGLLLIHPRMINWIWDRLNKQIEKPNLNWQENSAFLTFYGAIWLLAGPMLYCIINLVYPLEFVYIPSLIGMWTLSNILATVSAFTIGGVGVREVSLGILLAFILPTAVAVAVVVLVRVLWLLGELLTGLFSLVL